MDKRKLHHWLVVIRRVKTWQLLIILVLLVALSAWLLRQNNLGMIERRNLVKQTDQEAGNVQDALNELRAYVTSHMNTSLGEGVFLENSYQRAYDIAVQEAAGAISTNSQAYSEIEAACRLEYTRSGSFSTFIACVENGLKSLSPGSDPLASVKAPPVELFKYNFVSPVWSLDWAGLSVLAAVLAAVLIALRIIGYAALSLVLKLKAKH